MATPAAGGRDLEATLERRLKLLTSVVAPTTVLTALLFYYGYVATAAEFGYFGVSLGSAGLTSQDFLLRSVGAIYVPLGLSFLVVLLGLWSHAAVRRFVATHATSRRLRRVAIGLVVLGLLLLARGIVGVVVPAVARTESIAATPMALGFGVGALAYGRRLLVAQTREPTERSWTEPAGLEVVVAFLVLSLFWATNSFAAAYGRGQAQALADRLWARPAVVLDTGDRLSVVYDGIEESRLPGGDDARFRYRYRGLRLLVEADGRLFLLPEGWEPDTGAVIVVPSGGDVRLQFYRTGPP